MPSRFPGMDPYLETPGLWPDVHHALIAETQGALNRSIRPNYVARVELRVYVSNEKDPGRDVIIPDVRVETVRTARRPSKSPANGAVGIAIAEPYIVPILLDEEIEEARVEIRHVKSGDLVTIIEVLSPTNKIQGAEGRKSFLEKRHETLLSNVNWVEIDLLRTGLTTISYGGANKCAYRVIASKAEKKRCFRVWPIHLRDQLPAVGIPLQAPDADVALDLGAVLNAAYDRAAYDLSVDYSKAPDPPLAKDDAKWADKLLRSKGLR